MKIKDIIAMDESDDGIKILSIDPYEVVGIGKVNSDTGRQLIAIQDKEGNALKIALTSDEHVLMKGTEGITVSFKSGPPVKNKPTGITFKWFKNAPLVEVGDQAIMIIHGDSQEEEVPKEKELTGPPKLTEKTPLPPPTTEFIGFNDDYFRGKLEERRHLFNLVSAFNEEYSIGWPVDTMSQITTSLIMDGIHNNKTILKVQQPKKERFAPIDKPHNPEPVKEHPKADPIQDNIEGFLKLHAKSGWAAVEVSSGTPIIEALVDPVRRGGMMHFYFSCKACNTQLKGKNKERFDAIELFIDELPNALEHAMAIEALCFDISKKKELDYIADATKIESLAEAEATKISNGGPVANPRGIVMQYFKANAS